MTSQVRVFSLLGDSNVRPHITKTSCRANPQLKKAQVLSCGHIGIFKETLAQIRAESTVVIISCLTNFISSADGPAAVSHRVEPVLQEVRDALFTECEAAPNRHYLVSPPMYRSQPLWYREGLPEIMSLFSVNMNDGRPPNLALLPSYAMPSYEADGVHLTPFSGLEFVLHLFDASESLLDGLAATTSEVVTKSSESTRVLEDRMMAIEQDHRRLSRAVDSRVAVDAELADTRVNERNEDCFEISGLPRIPDEVVGKPWQDRAVRDVQDVLKILMGSEKPIVFIQNATTRQKNAEVTYNVKMANLSDSSIIRRKFGAFYVGGQDKRPDNLRHINIKIRLTADTKIRISIMKLLAKRYRDSNPGGRAQVVTYDPRPLIKITPPSSATDRRVKTYGYVEAVKTLPTNFSSSEIDPILRRVNPKHLGQVCRDPSFRSLVCFALLSMFCKIFIGDLNSFV